MLTIAPPDAAEARANATFEALIWSISRPGEVRDMGAAGFAPVMEALLDLECTAYADSPEALDAIVATGAEATGDVPSADHVFVGNADNLPRVLASARRGSSLYPDDGATIIIMSAIGEGQRLRLTGPGIPGSREVCLSLPSQVWGIRETLCLYPEGFDLFIVDGPRVVGIPRSTQVEVL